MASQRREFSVVLVSCVVCLVSATCCYSASTDVKSSDSWNSTKYVCSGTNAARIEFCARPLMDLIEGKVKVWPKSVQDISKVCGSFLESERCIRSVGRLCMKGMQKTIVSTIGGAVSRVRKSECLPTNLNALLELSKCSEHNQRTINSLMSNFTRYLMFVEDDKLSQQDLHIKTMRFCCLTREMPVNLRSSLGPVCSQQSTMSVVRLYSLLLEDVLGMVCTRIDMSKCVGLFEKFEKPTKDKLSLSQYNIISRLLTIIFSLGS